MLEYFVIFTLWILLWIFKDTVTAVGFLYLVYHWLREDSMNQAECGDNPILGRLHRSLIPRSDPQPIDPISDDDDLYPTIERTTERRVSSAGLRHVTAGVDSSYESTYFNRPLLYESQPSAAPLRRHTQSDIQYTPDTDFELRPEDFRGLLDPHQNRVRHSFALPTTNREHLPERQVQSASNARGEACDGIYRARRAISTEDFDENDLIDYYDDGETSSDDEFFLATDFADPLPKSNHSQSVDFLDGIIESRYGGDREDEKRRCASAVDIRDLQPECFTQLEKNNSSIESFPPESSDDEIESDEEIMSDDVSIVSERDYHRSFNMRSRSASQPFIYRRSGKTSPSSTSSSDTKSRARSESCILTRQRSLSSNMLADSIDMSTIENHEQFRGQLRAVLGLNKIPSRPRHELNEDTSLEFRSPHHHTNELLHKRLQRVLSSRSDINVDSPSQPIFARNHRRAKSVPLDIEKFFEPIDVIEDEAQSVEVIGTLEEERIYGDIRMNEVSEDERFIDSPLVVEYQLGRRHSPPIHNSDVLAGSQCAENTTSCEITPPNIYDTEVEQVMTAPQKVEEFSFVVHATPVMIRTPVTEDKPLQRVKKPPTPPPKPKAFVRPISQQVKNLSDEQIMSAFQFGEMSTPRRKQLPVRAIHPSGGPIATFSPHDSLADEGNSKGKGYFLRFDDNDSRQSRIPVKSNPRSPSKSPIKSSTTKTPVKSPTTKTPARRSLIKTALPSKPSPAKAPWKPAGRAPVKSPTKQTVVSPSKRVRAPSKSPTRSRRLSTDEPRGSRTRSVSPKILRREDNPVFVDKLVSYVTNQLQSESETQEVQSPPEQTMLSLENSNESEDWINKETILDPHETHFDTLSDNNRTSNQPIENTNIPIDCPSNSQDKSVNICQLDETSNQNSTVELARQDRSPLVSAESPSLQQEPLVESNTQTSHQSITKCHNFDLIDTEPNEVVHDVVRTEETVVQESSQTSQVQQTTRKPITDGAVKQTNNMSSSWMDRLKEDLDNDEEWCSDDEEMEFQREQELRMNQRQRQISSSSSDGEPPPVNRSYQRHMDSPSQRAARDQRVPNRQSDSYSSSDDDTGFVYSRSGPLRQSLSRGTAQVKRDYSDDSDDQVRGRRSPGQDEMDLMVKKNLVYVDSSDLDQMDILTSDLDPPSGQLTVEPGVGEFVSSSADIELSPPTYQSGAQFNMSNEGFETKQDSDGEMEVTGTIERFGSQEELVERQQKRVDPSQWLDKLQQYSSADKHSHTSSSSSDSSDREAVKQRLVNELAYELRDSQAQIQPDRQGFLSSPPIEEEVVRPSLNLRVDRGAPDRLEVMDYDREPGVVGSKNNRGRAWMKQLSQQYEQFEDQLPQPGSKPGEDEGVTSFTQPASDADHVRERVEDSMQDKIRDWRNMSADAAIGRVDEWQSLGNFNVGLQKHDAPEHYDDCEDKLRNSVGRAPSGYYDDINGGCQHFDPESDNDGYISDNSSQDTVKENVPKKLTLRGESVSSDDGKTPAEPEPEYVEILGGEEPPDEWLNLDKGMESVRNVSTSSENSSSSDSDTDFKYVPAAQSARPNQPIYEKYVPTTQSARPNEPIYDRPASYHPNPDYDQPPTTQPIHNISAARQYRPESNLEPPHSRTSSSNSSDLSDRIITRTPELSSPVTTREVQVETPTDSYIEELPEIQEELPEIQDEQPEIPETRPSADVSISQLMPEPVDKVSSSSSSSDEESVRQASVADNKKGRDRSYERVEQLRAEMKANRQIQSFDVPSTTRSSRATERFNERMKSLDEAKQLKESKKSTPIITGRGVNKGKFSEALNRFNSPNRDRNSSPSFQKPADSPRSRVDSLDKDTKQIDSKPSEAKPLLSTEFKLASRELLTRKASIPKVESTSVEIKTDDVIRQKVSASAQSAPPPALSQDYEIKPEPKPMKQDSPLTSPRSPRRLEVAVPRRGSAGKLSDKLTIFDDSPKKNEDSERVPTVTTRNYLTNRFERHEPKSEDQPHFDVDILIKKEQGENSDAHTMVSNNQTAQITLSKEQIKLSKLDRPPAVTTHNDAMNVWDTKTPVKDTNEKEVTITVRPQVRVNPQITNKRSTSESTPVRQTSSMALKPQDSFVMERIEPQNVPRISSAPQQPTYIRTQSQSPTRNYPSKSPIRDHPPSKGDSLDELRGGSLVAQTRNMFASPQNNTEKCLPPSSNARAYSTRKPEPFRRSVDYSSERPGFKEAISDLVTAYDQHDRNNEQESGTDYSQYYNPEQFDYTAKWVENNTDKVKPPYKMERPAHSQDVPAPDPVKDDAAFRRRQMNNKTPQVKHFGLPSHVTPSRSSSSPVPSATSDSTRGRSAEPNWKRPGRPARRARSLPRRKSAVIAEKASLFCQEDPEPRSREPVSPGRSLYGSRAQSPKHVPIKDQLSARKSMSQSSRPAHLYNSNSTPSNYDSPPLSNYDRQREHDPENISPKVPSKGVGIMVELYNKNKEYPLDDVDEQSLSRVDSNMFNKSSSQKQPKTLEERRVEDAPLSENAWKTWISADEKNNLEQRVENLYNRKPNERTTPRDHPINNNTRPSWQAVAPQPVKPTPVSPPRPLKSDSARQAADRRTWSTSPPPALPQRRFESYVPSNDLSPEMVDFDSYKQQTLQKFKQDEDSQYARIKKIIPPVKEQPVQPIKSHDFDQALLIQAPPPKPERLFNTAEPWDSYQPGIADPYQKPSYAQQQQHREPQHPGYSHPSHQPSHQPYNGYQNVPNHAHSQPQHNLSHPVRDERPGYPQPRDDRSGYNSQPVMRLPEHRAPPPQQNYNQQQKINPQSHFPERRSYNNGYPQSRSDPHRPDSHRSESHRPEPHRPELHRPEPHRPEPQRQDYRPVPAPQQYNQGPQQGYNQPPKNQYPQHPTPNYNKRPEQHVQPYQHHQDSRQHYPRNDYPQEPRYDRQPQSNGFRSPEAREPRDYRGYEPSYPEPQQQPPRRTNSVPNIKQQISPGRLERLQYDPRYNNDSYHPNNHNGSLPRTPRKEPRPINTGLPEFTPIQFVTGTNLQPTRPASIQPDHRYNKQYVPQQQPPQNYHRPSQYPSHGPPEPHNRPRPGVGVVYNAEMGVSDF